MDFIFSAHRHSNNKTLKISHFFDVVCLVAKRVHQRTRKASSASAGIYSNIVSITKTESISEDTRRDSRASREFSLFIFTINHKSNISSAGSAGARLHRVPFNMTV